MNPETALLCCFIGALIGVMLFFAAVVTPTAFRRLPQEHAGIYIRSIFPVYYLWAIVLAFVTAALAYGIDDVVFIITATVAILFVFSRLVLMPMIETARTARQVGEDGAGTRFRKLHLSSVLVNLSQMIMLFVSAGMLVLD